MRPIMDIAILNRTAMLGAILLLSGCGETSAEQPWAGPNIVNVSTVTATLIPVTLFDTLQGRVKPLRSANIHPQISGIITERLFKQGDRLKKGQPLFQIDPQTFAIDVAIKHAALKRAQADLALQQSQLDRLTELVKTQAVSKESFEAAQFNQQIAAASVLQNQAELQRSQLQLSYSTVIAPINGTIGAVITTEGALVSPTDSMPMAIIQQIDKVYIDVRLPVEKLPQLRQVLAAGDELGVTVELSTTPDDDIVGQILFSGISVDENTGDLTVRIEADNPKLKLLPGMYVRTKIPMPTINAAVIPQQALQRRGNGDPYVNVIVNEKVERRAVTVAGLKQGQYIVSTGLRAQDKVIVAGNEKLRPDVELKQMAWQQLPHTAFHSSSKSSKTISSAKLKED
ncbi:efflux RND transporter periplasmic adaptor subunit [Shewanella sp. KX20019]|uniref:efflux RND transporter periplasmic adaptor subunit n=1 Tax=Shewanella sp. KX20019 TaxID=2803864 RepID=UPI0019271209|nr:efflux RND transporter periplasmic adaptor subunit [Shewanella sp. KX20019]QQX78754.1 efflux RND transporter periplasmic adaptor subunit [Shewanella sp. KX20019]